MPVRRPGTSNSKVTKPSSKRGSRTSSLSSSAQEQLEQFAQQANSEAGQDAQDLAASDATIENAVDLNAANILTNGSITNLHPSLQPSFEMDNMQEEEEPKTAADVALSAYGDLVKIDSALCKKLANEMAVRQPTQRRVDQKLNMERRSNVEALLAQVTGELAPRPCKNCHKGHGPWTTCVIMDGQMCGSCSNCWFNASGSRCTFHENNSQPQSQVYAPSQPTAAATATPTGPSMLTYHAAPIAQPPVVGNSFPPLQADISHWDMSTTTRQIVNKALEDAAKYSRGKRLAARIEAAAKELAMRVAEFDEYSRSPEGIAELQREDAEAQARLSNPSLDHPSPEEALP
ncbi:Fc.00g077350.m01.CDS01 [Cosmosporella sp. VM-42]